jgi:hypothetical protein
VSVPDVNHGWVVGEGGTILATTNGGWPDRTPPTTTISDADSLWHNTDVSLTLSATDNPGGSGVDGTYYEVDGGSWVEGTSLSIPAPADHANDGLHTVSYYSTDISGNIETAQSVTVEIDTTAPVISVAYLSSAPHQFHSGRATYSSKAVRGHHASWHSWGDHANRLRLAYRVDDNLSPTVAVTIQLVNFRGKVLQTISLGWRPTGKLQVYHLSGKLPRGFWRLQLTATDLAGNTQSKLAGQHTPMHH